MHSFIKILKYGVVAATERYQPSTENVGVRRWLGFAFDPLLCYISSLLIQVYIMSQKPSKIIFLS